MEFCTNLGLTPFPMTESVLTYFVAFLYKEGLTAGTVKSYLSAARHTQISLELGDLNMPGMPQLEFVVKGLKKKTASGQRQTRLPITPEILRALKKCGKTIQTGKKQSCSGQQYACATSDSFAQGR